MKEARRKRDDDDIVESDDNVYDSNISLDHL